MCKTARYVHKSFFIFSPSAACLDNKVDEFIKGYLRLISFYLLYNANIHSPTAADLGAMCVIGTASLHKCNYIYLNHGA